MLCDKGGGDQCQIGTEFSYSFYCGLGTHMCLRVHSPILISHTHPLSIRDQGLPVSLPLAPLSGCMVTMDYQKVWRTRTRDDRKSKSEKVTERQKEMKRLRGEEGRVEGRKRREEGKEEGEVGGATDIWQHTQCCLGSRKVWAPVPKRAPRLSVPR